MQNKIEGERTILVVEDDPEISGLISCVLEDEGYAVITADNPDEAQRIAEQQRPDLVITDNRLPNPRDGVRLSIMLNRQVDPYIRMMFVTASPEDFTRYDILWLGAKEYPIISKPFDIDEFIVTARELLERSGNNQAA